jgi:two-component system, cell cycle sensor histidine kinase and response regulator CckA
MVHGWDAVERPGEPAAEDWKDAGSRAEVVPPSVDRAQRDLEDVVDLIKAARHEMGNIALVIMGNATLLRDETDPGSLAEGIDHIESQGHRITALMKVVVDFASPPPYLPAPADVGEVVAQCTDVLQVAARKRISSIVTDPGLPSVEVDHVRLRRTLLRMVLEGGAAIEHRGGSTIRIAIRREQRVRSEADPDRADRIVLDVRAAVSEPEPGEAPLGLTDGRGTLSPIERIDDVAESPLVLERVRSDRVLTLSLSIPVGPQPACTILVADDDQQVRTLTRRALERAGYRVVDAADGIAAIQVFQAAPRIDAVLIDVTMPGMDGNETLDELRQLRPELPAVLTSGFNHRRPLALNDVRTRFLPKPFGPVELVEAIRRVLGDAVPATAEPGSIWARART